MVKNTKATETASRELVITRIFDAPRELVWKAWTEPERFIEVADVHLRMQTVNRPTTRYEFVHPRDVIPL